MTTAACVALLLPSTPAHAERITAGDVLRLTFNLDPPPTTLDYGPLDYFEFAIYLRPDAPITSFTTRLYDGDRLLGDYEAPFVDASPSPTFVVSRFMSATSGYPGSATLVDFSAFNDLSIDGRLELTINMGSGTLLRTSDELSVGQGRRGNVIAFTGYVPTRTFEVIPAEAPVPEPGTILLAASGIAVVVRRRRRLSARNHHHRHEIL
jgi:hypothetical protein